MGNRTLEQEAARKERSYRDRSFPKCTHCAATLSLVDAQGGETICVRCREEIAEKVQKSRTLEDVVRQNYGSNVDTLTPTELLRAISEAFEELR